MLGQQMADAQQHFAGRKQLVVGRNEIGRSVVQVRRGGSCVEHFANQRLQAPFAGNRRQCSLLGLVRKIKVFQPFGGRSGLDVRRQFLGQLPLRLDRLEDRLLPLGQHRSPRDRLLDTANLLVVQTARLILAITGNEGDGVAVIQESDGTFDLR